MTIVTAHKKKKTPWNSFRRGEKKFSKCHGGAIPTAAGQRLLRDGCCRSGPNCGRGFIRTEFLALKHSGAEIPFLDTEGGRESQRWA